MKPPTGLRVKDLNCSSFLPHFLLFKLQFVSLSQLIFSRLSSHQLRNKLNQDQSVRLQQQRESLNKRNLEVATMDRRLAELRQRLWKKKAALQQKENQPVSLQKRTKIQQVFSVCTKLFLPTLGGSRGRGLPARCKLQSGGGGAVHPIILDIELPGAPGTPPTGGSGEAGVPRRHRHLTHARLVHEAPPQTG